jgi:hypothetical protein
MEKNEIKKALYKQNPKAQLERIRKGNAYYSTTIMGEDSVVTLVTFEIPVDDMGDADFFAEMESKHLQRWIM